jgi:homoserine/homoserine lactone efflux protein
MTLDAWLLFCATTMVLCFTPGPAVLLVVSIALTQGYRAGFGAVFGILAANALYFALSATSLGAVLVGSATVFRTITWIGAAYLVWLGIGMIRSSTPAATPAVPAGPSGSAASFRQGLITQGANPNAVLFFGAFVPQFIVPAAPVAPQMIVLGGSTFVIELVALGVYVAACQGARTWVAEPRFATRVRRLAGILLIVAAGRLAVARPG